MNIKRKEFIEKYCVKKDDGLIFPLFTYDSYDPETDSYTNLTITKTAEEIEKERENPKPIEKEEFNLTEVTKMIVELQYQIDCLNL